MYTRERFSHNRLATQGRYGWERVREATVSSGSKALALLLVLASAPLAATPAGAATFGEQMEFGVEMARKGLWREALFRFRQAGAMEPGNVRAMNNLAVAYEAVGLFEQALETYREGLRVSPNDGELRRNYSQFLEFYQSFESEDEGGDDGEGEDGEGDEDGAASPDQAGGSSAGQERLR
jgi:tetratricopeptide (TPR) repeat protein